MEPLTRTQLVLALLLAAVLGFGLGFLAAAGGFHGARERFRDTAAALKDMNRERASSPRQSIAPPPGM